MVASHRVSDGNSDGILVGDASTQPVQIGGAVAAPVGFHGTTPTSQRASATLSADLSFLALSGASWVANTASTFSGQFTYTSGQMIQLHDLLREIRNTLVGNGLHKGST